MYLTTDRLFSRPATRADAIAMADFVTRNRAFFAQWEPDRDESYYTKGGQTKAMLRAEQGWKTGTRFLFLMHRQTDEALLGSIHFLNVVHEPFKSCRLGYKIDQTAANNGYMTEGLDAALEFIFDIQGINRVEVNVMERNRPSLRVLEKLGFQNEGIVRQFLLVNGVREDHIRMVKLRD